jgi:hypothetical protein
MREVFSVCETLMNEFTEQIWRGLEVRFRQVVKSRGGRGFSLSRNAKPKLFVHAQQC